MWVKWLWFFCQAIFTQVVVNSVFFWQLKKAENLELFGHRFKTLPRFWLAYSACWLPLSFFFTIFVFYSWWYGFNVVFPGKIWQVQEIFWLASIVVMLFTAWFFFGELPTKNAVIALVFLAGALVAVLWK